MGKTIISAVVAAAALAGNAQASCTAYTDWCPNWVPITEKAATDAIVKALRTHYQSWSRDPRRSLDCDPGRYNIWYCRARWTSLGKPRLRIVSASSGDGTHVRTGLDDYKPSKIRG